MAGKPSTTQLDALKAMANGPLIRSLTCYHNEAGGKWPLATVEACLRRGWARQTAFGNHRLKARLTDKGIKALRNAGIEIAHPAGAAMSQPTGAPP